MQAECSDRNGLSVQVRPEYASRNVSKYLRVGVGYLVAEGEYVLMAVKAVVY